ncbi:ATP-dependent DNA helicase [Heracleum sosnowskyi]|uniref:ATP-dependent DNA helicase n=1 Tax=Heracleum sosnowskyi TaxID=360622 RepID=A0AAD8IZR5_9APIA|nr:ATP-dependent DNA helicase [Heracleum sosnowskyi]
MLLEDWTQNHVLGKVIGVAYTIEFQKRGLPHVHIVLWLAESDRCHSTEDIDTIISAEIPDKETDPIGFEAVSSLMVHGPCGVVNPSCACMKGEEGDKKCSKFFPKEFNATTTIDSNGYPVYRRRNNGRTIKRRGVDLDNRFIVPYNRGLLVKYQAHINVEWCHQGKLIKYMFKYVLKGPDCATMVIEKDGQPDRNDSGANNNDEIQNYLACRYLSSCEACWRIFDFSIHYRKPVVQKLIFHLEKEQNICYNEKESLTSVLRRNHVDGTMFVQWFQANEQYSQGRNLTYVQFPEKFRWDNTSKMWIPRKRDIAVVGRLIYVQPFVGELFYMRLLLNFVCGATSFEDLRTVNGVVYNSYKEACLHHDILGSDDDWHLAIQDASTHQTGRQLRNLFVTMLLFCDVSDVRSLWDKNWKLMSDDIEYIHRKKSAQQKFVIGSKHLHSLTLYDVDLQLRKAGKTLMDFPTLPLIDNAFHCRSQNTLLYEQYMYDRHLLKQESLTLVSMLNEKQKHIHEVLTKNVMDKAGGLFFVYGHGVEGIPISYSEWVINVGDGKVAKIPIDGYSDSDFIEIPPELRVDSGEDGKQAIINKLYSDLLARHIDPNYFRDRVILAPLNEDVDVINTEVLKLSPGQCRVYRSYDSICNSSVNYESQESIYPIEFLNSLKFGGIPNHVLELKVGAPIVLLRNISPARGLCNVCESNGHPNERITKNVVYHEIFNDL